MSNKSSKSVYLPQQATVSIKDTKETISIQGGIKSIDPPCMEQAKSDGPHAYTCKNCALQESILRNLMTKRSDHQKKKIII